MQCIMSMNKLQFPSAPGFCESFDPRVQMGSFEGPKIKIINPNSFLHKLLHSNCGRRVPDSQPKRKI